jgi:hypothetical protein
MSAQPKNDGRAVTEGADDGFDVVHQALRREVNERIRSISRDLHVGVGESMEVLCECLHTTCTGRIELTVAEYERVRRFKTHFFIKQGHDVSEGERVVAEAAGYLVVENSGCDDLSAVRTDDRRPPVRGAETVTP